MFPFLNYVHFVFIALTLWSILLSFMSIRFLFVIRQSRRIVRTQDIINCVISGIFGLGFSIELLFFSNLIHQYTSTFAAICTGGLVTLVYLTDYLMTSIRGLKP